MKNSFSICKIDLILLLQKIHDLLGAKLQLLKQFLVQFLHKQASEFMTSNDCCQKDR